MSEVMSHARADTPARSSSASTSRQAAAPTVARSIADARCSPAARSDHSVCASRSITSHSAWATASSG